MDLIIIWAMANPLRGAPIEANCTKSSSVNIPIIRPKDSTKVFGELELWLRSGDGGV